MTGVRLTECADYKCTYGFLMCLDDVDLEEFSNAVLDAKYKVASETDEWNINDIVDVLSEKYNVEFFDDYVVAI